MGTTCSCSKSSTEHVPKVRIQAKTMSVKSSPLELHSTNQQLPIMCVITLQYILNAHTHRHRNRRAQ